MIDILSRVFQHNEEDVLCAEEPALEATDHPKVNQPDALTLHTTPETNADRYDGLRQAGKTRHAS